MKQSRSRRNAKDTGRHNPPHASDPKRWGPLNRGKVGDRVVFDPWYSDDRYRANSDAFGTQGTVISIASWGPWVRWDDPHGPLGRENGVSWAHVAPLRKNGRYAKLERR